MQLMSELTKQPRGYTQTISEKGVIKIMSPSELLRQGILTQKNNIMNYYTAPGIIETKKSIFEKV